MRFTGRRETSFGADAQKFVTDSVVQFDAATRRTADRLVHAKGVTKRRAAARAVGVSRGKGQAQPIAHQRGETSAVEKNCVDRAGRRSQPEASKGCDRRTPASKLDGTSASQQRR